MRNVTVPRAVVTVLVVVVVLSGVVVLWQGWRSMPSSGDPQQTGWVSTKTGPLGDADRDLVIRVRLAGLWEMPAGQEAAERANQPRVRQVAQMISDEHMELDAKTRAVAKELGIVLPNQPNDQQKGFLSTITAASGDNYDATFVNTVRAAHGQILPVIWQIRTTTRNATIRQFAEEAAAFVARHIDYMESTGLVDYDALPQPPQPSRAVVTQAGEYRNVPVALVSLGVVLLATGVGGLLWRLLPRRPRHARRAATPVRRDGPSRRSP